MPQLPSTIVPKLNNTGMKTEEKKVIKVLQDEDYTLFFKGFNLLVEQIRKEMGIHSQNKNN